MTIKYYYAFHNTRGWYVYGVDGATGTEWMVPGFYRFGTAGHIKAEQLAKKYTANVAAGKAYDSEV